MCSTSDTANKFHENRHTLNNSRAQLTFTQSCLQTPQSYNFSFAVLAGSLPQTSGL
jgi:hypothetical protein